MHKHCTLVGNVVSHGKQVTIVKLGCMYTGMEQIKVNTWQMVETITFLTSEMGSYRSAKEKASVAWDWGPMGLGTLVWTHLYISVDADG